MNAGMLAKARTAVAGVTIQLASPFAVAEARVKRSLGSEAPSGEDLLAFWESRQPGSRLGDDRYRWEVSHKRCRPGVHVPPEIEWRTFRPDLPRDAEMELIVSLPVSIAEQVSLLDELVERGGDAGQRAGAVLAEAEPLMRRDLAARIAGTSPWGDTFALLCLVASDRALVRLGPMAVALATSYASLARDGPVLGWRNPLYEKPLASATAHLATALVRLGVELTRLGALARHVRSVQHPNGSFGDPHGMDPKFPRDELMTTLACARLLARIDPTFDPGGAVGWLVSQQQPSGFFVACGPELVWLTGEVLAFTGEAARPFAERFAFPHVAPVNLDRKTQLPFYAYFDDLAHLFAELPGIGDTRTELAFIDLAGFGAFNNAHGQDMGDLVLGAFATRIAGIAGARAVRDGGDEFLVVGAPTRAELARDLDGVRRAWAAECNARFPGVVAPRILVTTTKSREIRACREGLGKRLGALKARAGSPPPEGVLEIV